MAGIDSELPVAEADDSIHVADGPSDLALRQQSIDKIESLVNEITEQTNVEQIVKWLNITSVLLSRAKHIRQTLERVAVQWIEAHGPIDIGNIRYTVGHQKNVTCTDVVKCAELLLENCEGDLTTMCAYLRSDPYKYGSVQQLIGDERFAMLFRVEHKPKLVEGKPQKPLVRIDRRYVR